MSRLEADTARLPLLLGELRLPAIGRLWPELAERSDREGWPAARFLSALAEIEIAERARRRIERHLAEARLPPDACRRSATAAQHGHLAVSGKRT